MYYIENYQRIYVLMSRLVSCGALLEIMEGYTFPPYL